jgi:hypothetical protein
MVGLRVLLICPHEHICHKHTEKMTTRRVGMLKYKSGGGRWCVVISSCIFMFAWRAEILALNVTTVSSWQHSNTFARWQMTTENETTEELIADRYDWRLISLSTSHRVLQLYVYTRGKKNYRFSEWLKCKDLETGCWQSVSTFRIIIFLELKVTAIASG